MRTMPLAQAIRTIAAKTAVALKNQTIAKAVAAQKFEMSATKK